MEGMVLSGVGAGVPYMSHMHDHKEVLVKAVMMTVVISLTKLGDTEIVSCIAFGKKYSDKWASFAEQDTFRKAALNIEKAWI